MESRCLGGGFRFAVFAGAIALIVWAPRVAFGAPSARDLAALKKASLIYVATVRKDGNQSKAAPVWFTLENDENILIETAPKTWKAKRIRRGSPVIIWIGKRDGPAFIGKAAIVGDPELEQRIAADYPRKYLAARVGLARPTMQKFESGQIIAIKIETVRDLPERFASKPGTPAPALEEAPAVAR